MLAATIVDNSATKTATTIALFTLSKLALSRSAALMTIGNAPDHLISTWPEVLDQRRIPYLDCS